MRDSMLTFDVREQVIRPALQVTNLWSESAEILVFGTGVIESNYNHLVQIGEPTDGGLSFWQIQPSTYLDIIKWLNYPINKILANSIMSACFYTMLPLDPKVLIYDIRYAALMCRAHYLRVPAALPSADSAKDLGAYYKTYYNTKLGKAKLEYCIETFKGLINE